MTGRFQSIIAVALALSVLVILVSPLAASELTTLRAPQKVRPSAVAIPLAVYAPLAAWLTAPAHSSWETRLLLPGSEVVSMTCARLC